jgi:hypothetical protein
MLKCSPYVTVADLLSSSCEAVQSANRLDMQTALKPSLFIKHFVLPCFTSQESRGPSPSLQPYPTWHCYSQAAAQRRRLGRRGCLNT